MENFNIKKQIRKLYLITGIGCFQIAGASWVALLAMRGFSLVEIGLIESIFHIVSMTFEIPTGAMADTWGRKKTMILSQCIAIVSCIFMIMSNSFFSVAFAVGLNALGYNLASGTREALAYDSLKKADCEKEYDRFASTEMMLYRISSSAATLCAGFALWLGHKYAYSIDIIVGFLALLAAVCLVEMPASESTEKGKLTKKCLDCIKESIAFLKSNRKARLIIFINSIIGSVATLMLFFLQAKLPQIGLDEKLLGPALFIMGLGAALGSKAVRYFSHKKYGLIIVISLMGITLASLSMITKNPYIMFMGGFIAAFSDDFLEVRTDIVLNKMIPSEQRATLVSICSFTFSIVMIFLSPIMGWMFG